MRIYLAITFLWVASHTLANPLVEAANKRLEHTVIYDGSYQKIAYPMGDVDASKGVCTDVIIRSYRALGIDLQQLVHEDMAAHFDQYPTSWGLNKPDTNIDHRRVPNLETFYTRHGKVLPITDQAEDYKPGNIVTWRLSGSNLPHIGIVSDQKAETGNYKIIHNIGWGLQINDMLFDHPIQGHYQY
ncbi:Uncharacterized protein YijF [hydrothermal vent metagenome]|uniref:Uncharacterized protein YijF n=1 Tax=hydrothermal vent metagenome TaxID=652676 RepID=A0A3B0W8C0_9ZZZZ